MIYAPRSSDTNHTCTKIQFHDFEISIALDDRSIGGTYPLTRCGLAVYKDGKSVTEKFAGSHKVENGEILEPEGMVLFEIMQAIAAWRDPALHPTKLSK